MKKWIFTFGQGHCTTDGTPMNNYYVLVHAPDFGSAREHFCQHFALPMMGNATKWAFQYEAENFDHERWCPLGCFDEMTVSLPEAMIPHIEKYDQAVRDFSDIIRNAKPNQGESDERSVATDL